MNLSFCFPQIIAASELVFGIIFTVEALLKILAQGFILDDRLRKHSEEVDPDNSPPEKAAYLRASATQ